jgi:heme/copper-type cytochrome/quinol oxidase subunit 2
LTVAQILLVAAGAVFVVVHARLAGDLVRTRGSLGGAAHTAFGLELAWTILPLLAVLTTLAVAVAVLGRGGPR